MKRRERHKMVSKRGFIWLKTFPYLNFRAMFFSQGYVSMGPFLVAPGLSSKPWREPQQRAFRCIAANISERKRSLLSWLGTCLQTSTQEGIRPGIETLPLLLPQLHQLHQPCTPLLPPCPPPPSPPSPPNPLQRLPQKRGWLPTQANWRNIWR